MKKAPHSRAVISSATLSVDDKFGDDSFHPDFLQDCADVKEDIPSYQLVLVGLPLEMNIFVDDHAREQRTRRSITGLSGLASPWKLTSSFMMAMLMTNERGLLLLTGHNYQYGRLLQCWIAVKGCLRGLFLRSLISMLPSLF